MPGSTEVPVPPSPAEARAVAFLRCAMILFVALAAVRHGVVRPLTIHGVNYPKHWHAARAILAGESPYVGPDLYLHFNYPQFGALATCWLGWFDYRTAEFVWKGMLLACVAGVWAIAARAFRPETEGGGEDGRGRVGADSPAAPLLSLCRAISGPGAWGTTCAFFVAGYSPLLATSVYLGQIDPVNGLLATAFVAAILRGRERAAGVLLAMLCLVKVMPIVLLLPLLLWRRWKILLGFGAFALGYALLLAATGRLGHERFFVFEMAGEIPFRWREISISPHVFLATRILPPEWLDDRQRFDALATATTLAIATIHGGALVAAARRGGSFLRAIEVSLAFLPLHSPLFETHHTVWIFPVFLLQWKRWCEGRMSPVVAAGLAAGWGLVFGDSFWTEFSRLGPRSPGWFNVLYGAAIVAALSAWDALRESGRGGGSASATSPSVNPRPESTAA